MPASSSVPPRLHPAAGCMACAAITRRRPPCELSYDDVQQRLAVSRLWLPVRPWSIASVPRDQRAEGRFTRPFLHPPAPSLNRAGPETIIEYPLQVRQGLVRVVLK